MNVSLFETTDVYSGRFKIWGTPHCSLKILFWWNDKFIIDLSDCLILTLFFMWEKKRKQIMVWLHFWRSLYIPIFFFFSITLGWIYWIRSNPLHLIMVYHLYFMRIQSHTKKTHTHFHGIPIMWIIFQWFSPFLTSPWINAYVRMCVFVCAQFST